MLAIYFLSVQNVSAATISTNGITVSPAIISVDLQKDQASSTFKVKLTNNTSKSISLTVSSLDFKTLNETGGLAFIGSNVAESAKKYSLAAWLITPEEPVTIAAKQTLEVPIVIDNRSDLSPGGHYAAVLYNVNSDSSASGSVKVNVNQVASTLLFVRKIDGATFGVDLNPFRVRFSWWQLPKTIDLSFLNTGNSQTVPRGLVTVSTLSGKEVRRGQINTNSSILLPETSRSYSTPIMKTGSAFMPGLYKVHVTYRTDDISKNKTAAVNFTFVNLPGIIALILAIYIIKKYLRRVIHSVVKKTQKQVKKVLKKLR